jgi:hypothetical protein
MAPAAVASERRAHVGFRCITRTGGPRHPGQVIAQHVPSFIEYPPMQAGANFNIGDLKAKVEQAIAASKAHGD